MADLPGGAKIPVPFTPGRTLTAEDLNLMQEVLMRRILTHDHTGNDQQTPQGELIDSDGIKHDAIRGQHISENAVCKGDIHNGAVGASEIQEKCIGSSKLADEAVGTPHLKDGSVTVKKLADEVSALLSAPRQGATTYAYCAYLDGKLVYPTETGPWYTWLLDKAASPRQYDLPIRRQRDDGGWQPIKSITPPDGIPRIQPNMDLATRAEISVSLMSLLKQNEAVVREVLGGAVTEVRAEGDHWKLSVSSGEALSLGDADLRGMLDRLGASGADLSRGLMPLRTRSMSLFTALDSLAGMGGAKTRPAAAPQPIMRAPSEIAPIIRLPGREIIVDPGWLRDRSSLLMPTPSVDLQERNRTAMLVDPQAIGWPIAQEGQAMFQPGVGGNAVFSDSDQEVLFQPGQTPSEEEFGVIERILGNVGIELDRSRYNELLDNPKIYDFLNHPHLLGAGYWTGVSRNIRAVTCRTQNGRRSVRISFTQPYASTSYVVAITPDVRLSGTEVVPVTAYVLSRKAGYVDLLFLQGTESINKLSFSIAIQGELVQS